MFRLSIRSMVELSVALVLGLSGFAMLVGTVDEFKSGRAFDRAMDHYVARHIQPTYDYLYEAIQAKAQYDAPLEALGKLHIDDGRKAPEKLKEAMDLFKSLYEKQKSGSNPSLPTILGLAAAELETALVGADEADIQPALRAVLARLREGEALYPNSGDLHLNLATLDLLAGNPEAASRRIAKVYEVGDISMDALPYLHNLEGLVALRAGDLDGAVSAFAKADTFDPNWGIPRLNLAAAHARQLIREDLPANEAAYHVREARRHTANLKRMKHPLLPAVHHALAIHHLRTGDNDTALRQCGHAKDAGATSWYARFTTFVGHYQQLLTARLKPHEMIEHAQTMKQNLEKLIEEDKAAAKYAFATACMFGTLDAKLGSADEAIAQFTKALQLIQFGGAAGVSSQDTPARLHRCLAALYLTERQYTKAIPELEACRALKDTAAEVDGILAQLRLKPAILNFKCTQASILTDHDLRYSARLVAAATPLPIALDKIRVTLSDSLTKTTRPAPFRFTDGYVHGVMANLPQGKFTFELRFTDALDNESAVSRHEFEIDREPPRVVERQPAAGATVSKLSTLRFVLHDSVSAVNFEKTNITLNYPAGAATTNRLLASRGKYANAAADGSVAKGAPITAKVACPVPGHTPPGEYTVTVHVEDSGERKADVSWTFRLATEEGLR